MTQLLTGNPISTCHLWYNSYRIKNRFGNSLKVYYTLDDKNITEMQTVGYAVSEAGIRAPLYWYHDAGYFEEYLAHKKGA